MSAKVRFHANAERDLERVVLWYDQEAPEQVERFTDEFFAAARRLEQFPEMAPAVVDDVRRVSLSVFPYQIWYRFGAEHQVVEVLAVTHDRQDPVPLRGRFYPR